MHGRARTGAARGIAIAAIGIAIAIAIGCGSGEEPAGGGEGEAPPAAERPATAKPQPEKDGGAAMAARQIFETRCAVCHGVRGAGDGPGSAGLDPQPRDFRDAEWQESVTDDHITKIIKFGGAAVGKSPTMPGNPDLLAKPEVVQGLVEHIRSLREG